MSFKNKVVLIIGGSSGIGASAAELFCKEDADVVIVGCNEAKLEGVTEKCSRNGAKVFTIKADITKDEEIENIIKSTLDKYGKLDVLVNAAAGIKYATILSGNLLQVYDDMIATNLRSVVRLINSAAPHLIKTQGCIINISSLSGTNRIGVPEYTPYGLSKAGLRHFSRAAALELAEHGVRVNTITPGPVNTVILETAQCIKNWNDFIRWTALKRISEPVEIAEMIVFLASDKAKAITGANFVVDNGMLLKK